MQVGDPFEEKKLLECSLELLERGLLRSLQDLGAAGLTSSAAEMASKGGVGIDVDVAKVPLREPEMEPFEVMVSESQERMLCVVEPADVEAVLGLCEKWEVNGAVIGTVTDSGRMRVLVDGELVGDMSVRALVDDCPLYDLHPARPAGPIYPPPPAMLAADATPREALLALLASPNLASRRPLFEQYDAIVQSRTVRRPEEADAAVLLLPDGGALAVSIDGNGRRVAADPYARNGRCGGRVCVEPRVRRRRAARHDEQSQLRQPREGARRVAADRIGARPRRRLPRAAGADRRGQRVAVQRG